ncbi:hypothetical protein [Azotobacter beijerinckii]|uniref:Uncharacterized protein n=1 Tax=Azotobacter beijerinckii TaxID=170623 RepID=A0A1I1BNM8_9GAMM|nr:hypothetical protein [Azotobacter beijerinckii]SFB52044.1 hypothetical protein SAMN04244571_03467 [Azotobacter beijerinckii]
MKKAAPQYQQSRPTRCDCTAAIAHLHHTAAELLALFLMLCGGAL